MYIRCRRRTTRRHQLQQHQQGPRIRGWVAVRRRTLVTPCHAPPIVHASIASELVRHASRFLDLLEQVIWWIIAIAVNSRASARCPSVSMQSGQARPRQASSILYSSESSDSSSCILTCLYRICSMYPCHGCVKVGRYLQLLYQISDTVICPMETCGPSVRCRSATLCTAVSQPAWPWLRSFGSLNWTSLVGPQRWKVEWIKPSVSPHERVVPASAAARQETDRALLLLAPAARRLARSGSAVSQTESLKGPWQGSKQAKPWRMGRG